ncbi:interferon regulatory factor 1 [Desmophyllum pertusum]|uniref:Interferon regulatory factor 1 n=1 Tax=Desmophyllum pertusum TaxID=174260 RepID=A0A9W9Z739_9CNID|nr:interferon regulatory factor 1 [Desmophyllum pertusum]
MWLSDALSFMSLLVMGYTRHSVGVLRFIASLNVLEMKFIREGTMHHRGKKIHYRLYATGLQLEADPCTAEKYKDGRDKPDPRKRKTNFRGALNTLPDIKEIRGKSCPRGKDAFQNLQNEAISRRR